MDNKVIYAYLRGGLGNQMFIYAAARAFQIKYFHGEGTIKFGRKKQYGYFNDLNNYQITPSAHFTTDYLAIPRLQELMRLAFTFHFCKTPQEVYETSKRRHAIMQKFGLIRADYGFCGLSDMINGPILADGYFQSEKFFAPIRDTLCKEFVPKMPPMEKNLPVMKQIAEAESVALCVRLGDYVNNPMHWVCTPQYYQAAMEKMKQLHPNATFFLFSDDIELAKSMLSLPQDIVCEPLDNPAYESLRILSGCKHFIISNSSFHWWAQYLSAYPNKTVIAPSRWYAEDIPTDIYCDDWIRLEV